MLGRVQYTSRIPEIIASLDPRTDAAMAAGAELIELRAKERVPVESGDLRDAIHTSKQDDGYYVFAGDSLDLGWSESRGIEIKQVYYGHMVEFGTKFRGARPYLIPATEASFDEVLDLVRASLQGL